MKSSRVIVLVIILFAVRSEAIEADLVVSVMSTILRGCFSVVMLFVSPARAETIAPLFADVEKAVAKLIVGF